MQRFGSVYLVTNLVNGKQYVGQTTNSIAQRWKSHRGAATRQNPPGILHKAIKKYGADKFSVTELVACFSREALDAAEDMMIVAYETPAPNGYNLKNGGGGRLHSEESKRKMADSRRGLERTDEWRANLSKAGKGRKFTAEHRANISAAKKGKPAPHRNRPIVDECGNVYPTIDAAAAALGTSRQNINGVLHGRQHTAGGHTFTYLEKGA